jgi:hypothetical protein
MPNVCLLTSNNFRRLQNAAATALHAVANLCTVAALRPVDVCALSHACVGLTRGTGTQRLAAGPPPASTPPASSVPPSAPLMRWWPLSLACPL